MDPDTGQCCRKDGRYGWDNVRGWVWLPQTQRAPERTKKRCLGVTGKTGKRCNSSPGPDHDRCVYHRE